MNISTANIQTNNLMTKFLILFSFLAGASFNGYGQSTYSGDPDSVSFVTKDINNFWIAFDDFKKDTTVNNFGAKYIDIGSEGVKGFIPTRIINEDHLFKIVKKKTADYEKVRENTLRLTDKVKQCRSTFYAFKFLYPEAKFPSVYFVVGAFNTVGTSGKYGLILGAEKQNNIDYVPIIVAHELIHFQQTWLRHSTLLTQSIIEGSADFIGELIVGRTCR